MENMEDHGKIIQWYPGHMAKAKRMMNEKINLIDVVFELVDARAPESSKNPYIKEIAKNKTRIVLLNKADIADSRLTEKYIQKYKDEGIVAVSIDSRKKKGAKLALKAAAEAFQPELEKRRKKGLKDRPIRVMVVGVPNVGKSTLINKLAGHRVAVTGDIAGITRVNQWIKITNEVVLLDTPGILWNKFDSKEQGLNIALIGAIKQNILPIDDVVIYGINFMLKYYYQQINERYELDGLDLTDSVGILDHIANKRGCFTKNHEIDYDRVYQLFLNDLRLGYLGRITYDRIN